LQKAKITREGAELLRNKFGLNPEEEGMIIIEKDYSHPPLALSVKTRKRHRTKG
jgi:hypothetical protein